MPLVDHSQDAMRDPQVGDHWKEWKDWDTYIVERTATDVTMVTYSGGHAPMRVTRAVGQFTRWLTFGGMVARPWAVCVARGLDLGALKGDVLPLAWAPTVCDCRQCLDARKAVDPVSGLPVAWTRMVLCTKCGNKRCPHATDHRNACTASNEPGQVGSAYGAVAA